MKTTRPVKADIFMKQCKAAGLHYSRCGPHARDLLKFLRSRPLTLAEARQMHRTQLGALISAGLARWLAEFQVYAITPSGETWLAELEIHQLIDA